jgi:hypothetical protein
LRLALTGDHQPTEWQRVGNRIDAAMIFTWADFVKKKLYVLRSYP